MNPDYTKARFKAELPNGGPPDSFAIVTAYNPEGETISAEENIARSATFQAQLQSRGLSHFPITGYDPESSHAEPGFGIVCDPATGIALGKEQRQEAIFYIDSDRLALISCKSDHTETALGSWIERVD